MYIPLFLSRGIYILGLQNVHDLYIFTKGSHLLGLSAPQHLGATHLFLDLTHEPLGRCATSRLMKHCNEALKHHEKSFQHMKSRHFITICLFPCFDLGLYISWDKQKRQSYVISWNPNKYYL